MRPIFLLPLLLVSAARAATPSLNAFLFHPTRLTFDESYATEAVEGLANRNAPTLFIPSEEGDDRWLSIYSEKIHFTEIPDFPALLETYKSQLKGLALYDPKIDATRCIALTLAGTDNLLPVDPDMLASPAIQSLHLPIAQDLRNRFSTSVAAYAWALDNVLPRCDRAYAHTPSGPDVDGLHVGMGPFRGFDFTIAHRGFIFNLALNYKDTQSFGTTVIGNKPQADMYRQILSRLQPPALFLGYGEFEWNWFNLLGENGHTWLHWGSNLSFHEKVPVDSPPKQPAPTTPADPKKIQVCFITSEGDTMKGLQTFFYQSWSDPARGTVPINWAIPPESSRFPAMLNYYYHTATPNDCFIAYDILNLPKMPNLESFAHHRAEQMHAADLHVIALSSADLNSPNLETYLRALHPEGAAGIEWQKRSDAQSTTLANIPYAQSAKNLAYWQNQIYGWRAHWQDLLSTDSGRNDAIEKLIQNINAAATSHTPPFVILVYGDIHNYPHLCDLTARIAAKLDPTRFQLSRLDTALQTLAH